MVAPIAGYRTTEKVMGFNLSHWARVSGGYSPRKAATAAMVIRGDLKNEARKNWPTSNGIEWPTYPQGPELRQWTRRQL
jgi:hypothetical protein